MSQKCYVQQRDDDWLNINCASAAYGFRERGFEVVPFTRDQVYSLNVTADTVVVGAIPVVRQALKEAGFQPPPALVPPHCLWYYLQRASWNTTLGEIRQQFLGAAEGVRHRPVFIKPRDVQKAFTGHVVSAVADLIDTNSLSDDLALLGQEVVEFTTEWRAFVQDLKVVHFAHYHGDPMQFPDVSLVHAILHLWPEAPAACSIDIGLLKEYSPGHQTALVEVNDGYALGSYGMEPVSYSKFLETRWREMTQETNRWGADDPQRVVYGG